MNQSISSGSSPGVHVNVACIPIQYAQSDNWILDSGETNHMSSRKDWLYNIREIPISEVKLPNGYTSRITHTGDHCLKGGIILKNGLFVPVFRYVIFYQFQELERIQIVQLVFIQDLLFYRISPMGGYCRFVERQMVYTLAHMILRTI